MAVEKMEMIDIIGRMDDVDDIARILVLSSAVHMVDAITEIKENNFPILKAQENVDAVIDYNYIRQYSTSKNLSGIEKKLKALYDMFELKREVNPEYFNTKYNFLEDASILDKLYDVVKEKHERLEELNEELKSLLELENYLGYMKHINVDINEAMKMEYIGMKLGKIPRHNLDKLKKNYENISSIVYKLHEDANEVVVLQFIPRPVEIEVDRVLMSLDFEEYPLNTRFSGTPSDWLISLNKRKVEIAKESDTIRKELKAIRNKYEENLERFYSRLSMEYKIEELKSHIACTKEFFYLTGWIPSSRKDVLLGYLGRYNDTTIMIFKETNESKEVCKPPTCLKNNYILKPFEAVVKMYGIPSYGEMDPTGFLGITYMILFGAMFGDVGQGLVLFLVGEILSRLKKRPNMGGVVARLGISSTIFGFLYGSIFGFEDVLKAIIVKPMDSINTVLVAAIGFGTLLLSAGFIYNLINCYKNKDIEKGVFSRDGVVGLAFYWILLYFLLSKVIGYKTIVPGWVLSILLISLLLMILLKQPITNLIKGVRPLYNESKMDYFVEEGFGVIETLLSLFSNTVSFIRVGAFAINHVGLFLAFDALAKMMSNGVESALMLVLGNIVIIGLEGLIVFIQGLRLEYYELFSKYFEGSGYEYNPVGIHIPYRKNKNININIKSAEEVSI